MGEIELLTSIAMDIPIWGQYILGLAAILTAITVIWKYLLKPTLQFYGTAEKGVPLVRKLVETFESNPEAFDVLEQIAAQFRTDSGSSLKDQINRLEEAAIRQEAAAVKAEANADHLKIGVETQKQLAEDDRRKLSELMIQLGVNANAMAAMTANIANMQATAREVARDLADSHSRADAITGAPGEAADAAAQQTEKEKRENS